MTKLEELLREFEIEIDSEKNNKLEKYIDNYRPGLVDHMKWSEDFNTEFLRNIRRSF